MGGWVLDAACSQLAQWRDLGVSVPTLLRLEAGEPGVSLGVLATALWLIGRDGALATLATPAEDRGALELDVRAAEAWTEGKHYFRIPQGVPPRPGAALPSGWR